MLKSNVTNAIIFTVGAIMWHYSYITSQESFSLYIALLFTVGASIYWVNYLSELTGK